MARRDYITREGWQRLADELDTLWREKRPHVTRELSAAAAEGDRSENAEYIYRKKELREIDRRVRYLRRRIDELTVVDTTPDDRDAIFFGAWVDVVDDNDAEHRYRIVGADETDAATGAISINSPVARALIGRRLGDVIGVPLPQGRRELEIIAISYMPPPR